MGTVRYELNPPKITTDTNLEEAVEKGMNRLRIIMPKCNAVHITENVLGIDRVSPITMGRKVRDEMPKVPVTVSLRVRDKTEEEITEFVDDCINLGFSGILILMGDPPRSDKPDTGQIPSTVTNRLKSQGVDSKIDLYMSISNEPTPTQIRKKIEADPSGFFTQVVHSIGQVDALTSYLYGFNLIPVLLHPSEKNQKAADFLHLNMKAYAKEFESFAKEVYSTTGDILITSPNDFAALDKFLTEFRFE